MPEEARTSSGASSVARWSTWALPPRALLPPSRSGVGVPLGLLASLDRALTSTSHCTRVGGRVEERSEQAASQEDGDARAVGDLVVRVPADELTGVLAGLEELGDVADVRVSRST